MRELAKLAVAIVFLTALLGLAIILGVAALAYIAEWVWSCL